MENLSTYKFHSQVIVRTPFYDCSSYEQSLSDIVRDPYFLAAIYLSSKSLFDALKRNSFEIAHLSSKEQFSVKMYFNRMCFRPTPFGLSSGITVVHWSSEDDLYFDCCPELHGMLGFSSSLLIAERIIKEIPDFTPSYVLNKTIYRVNNEFRYLRIMPNTQGKENVIIDSIELTEMIINILSYFNKKHTKADLIGFLMKEYDVSLEEGVEFTEELIDKQIIWPEFYPNITGEDYINRVNKIIFSLNYKSPEYLTIKNLLGQITQSSLSEISANLALFEKQVKQLLIEPYDNIESPIYLNIERRCVKGGVDCSWQRKILEGLSGLQKIVPPYKNKDLSEFVSNFKKKFDLRWVPLLVALDPETGIDYHSLSRTIDGSFLLNQVQLEYPCNSTQTVQWSQIHKILLRKWGSLSQAKCGVPTIVLEEQDFVTFPEHDSRLNTPPSISILFRIVGDMVYIEEAGGSSAISINGRFTAFNQKIKQASEELSAIEESVNPEIIFAEIAYCSNPRMGNINRRANIRRYEIPILTGSDLPEERQIPLNDLWISVVNDEIILWSRKLHKRIIPRLSSAFNYQRSTLPAFRFLCDLQFQGIQPSFTLDLSDIFPNLGFYPRVEYKEAILHLASWHFDKGYFIEILSNPDEQVRLSLLRKIVAEMNWPKFISIHQFDNYLVIDTSKDEELEFLINVLKKSDHITIKEFPFLDKKGSQDHIPKRYIQQYIASIYHHQTIYNHLNPAFEKVSSFKAVNRKFLPGSQWIYFKIYCHPFRSSSLLVKHILPLFNRWFDARFLNQWFFVRYKDPEYHLRVRLNADPVNTGLLVRGLTNTLAPLVNAGIISDLQTGIYEREIERYGPDIIQDLERSFCSSTHLVCKFFSVLIENDTDNYSLFEFAYTTLNILLSSFKYELADKSRLFEQFYHYMYSEFKYSDKTKDQLKRKFREIRDKNKFLSEQDFLDKYKILVEMDYFRYTLRQLNPLTSHWTLSRKDELVGDIIHMHLNRIFSSSTRRNELVVYYCLWRHFASELGRQDKNLLKPLTDK